MAIVFSSLSMQEGDIASVETLAAAILSVHISFRLLTKRALRVVARAQIKLMVAAAIQYQRNWTDLSSHGRK